MIQTDHDFFQYAVTVKYCRSPEKTRHQRHHEPPQKSGRNVGLFGVAFQYTGLDIGINIGVSIIAFPRGTSVAPRQVDLEIALGESLRKHRRRFAQVVLRVQIILHLRNVQQPVGDIHQRIQNSFRAARGPEIPAVVIRRQIQQIADVFSGCRITDSQRIDIADLSACSINPKACQRRSPLDDIEQIAMTGIRSIRSFFAECTSAADNRFQNGHLQRQRRNRRT